MEIVSNNSDDGISSSLKKGTSAKKATLSKTAKDGFFKANEFHLGPASSNR